MNQSVEVPLDQGATRTAKIGRRDRKGRCLSPMLCNLYSEYHIRDAVDGLGNFSVGGQVILNVKYADNLVVLPGVQTVLQSMIGRITEIGRCYGREMSV
jgi:hypothetical protein